MNAQPYMLRDCQRPTGRNFCGPQRYSDIRETHRFHPDLVMPRSSESELTGPEGIVVSVRRSRPFPMATAWAVACGTGAPVKSGTNPSILLLFAFV